jgi:hypothetical protein
MTFEQQWLEYDYNPFILFSSSGKIISLNTEAQFLLANDVTAELFKLATTYANITFGFKTTFLELEFGRYKFFGITVGYENDDEIGIKLYQAPKFKLNNPKPQGELINIYTLVDLCISTNSIGSNVEFVKDFDPTIPKIIINSNGFLKLLNKVYACYTDNNTIKTKIYCRVGEHIKFEDNKYGIFSVEIIADNLNSKKALELESLTDKSGFYLNIQDNITINIPMITA